MRGVLRSRGVGLLAAAALCATAATAHELAPSFTPAATDVLGVTMICVVSPCMPSDAPFWEYCPRNFPQYPVIIPSWYVHGHKACGPDPGGEPYIGSFHCCAIGAPLPAGAAAPAPAAAPWPGLPGGASCADPVDCASGLCLLGVCAR